jgi:signal transduction histidine kinase
MKNNLSRLVPAVEREIREAEIRRDRRRIENEKEHLVDELQDKNVELRAFTFAISHDLKNPLVTIKGFLGMLQKDIASGNPKDVETSIRFISKAATEMEGLLKDLLNLSRVGHLVQSYESIPFSHLARVTTQMMAEQIRERGIQLTVKEDTTELWGDPVRMKQVLLNLMTNAVKFMGDQPDPEIEIGVRRGTNGPVFFVKDNGIGVEPKYYDNIFGLFNKLDLKTEGTGVGLAIVKRIIQLHNGRIWVESEGKGKGATFCFTLPNETEKKEAAA